MASDLAQSARRIAADVEALTGERYTLPGPGITRYAYTDAYAATLDYFRAAFEALGFEVWSDPVGTFVASNVGPRERAFGMGSHCDSNRNGGPWDGTLGVVSALEACRIAHESGLDLPLRVIAFLEEEASGFGQMLLGSRIVLGTVTDEELASYRDEHGVPFLEAAARAAYRPDERARAGEVLDGLVGWIELHIEQGRVLQDTGGRLGVVDAIAGYIHADVVVEGRADHAGATPMGYRSDAGITAAEAVVELERIVTSHSRDTVGTIGALSFGPGIINVIPGRAEMTIDIRSVSGDHEKAFAALGDFVRARAAARDQRVDLRERNRVASTKMDPHVVEALERAAQVSGAPWRRMPSGAAHDTQMVARRVPSAMLFVPCVDGISHSPEESADPADAALGVQIMLAAVRELLSGA
jgi:hydantoinase/carbamoylase family amidase